MERKGKRTIQEVSEMGTIIIALVITIMLFIVITPLVILLFKYIDWLLDKFFTFKGE